MNGIVRIGTSGWHYDHWYGYFYPEQVKKAHMLDYYQQIFGTVEINNTFYRLPKTKTFTSWKQKVGKDFCFAVKASRYITHMKKLKNTEKPLRTFLDRISALGKTRGPVLFQLPPHWKKNTARLQSFLEAVPKDIRSVLEFRNKSWFDREVNNVLRKYNAAFCMYELGGDRSPKEVTADFIYIRLHGPGAKYQGRYNKQALESWAESINSLSTRANDVYCYFNNDQTGYAAENARELNSMLHIKPPHSLRL
jgi:uncharacterized protein YecE (DUF72 family)